MAERVGQQLGNYQLQRLLGRGGFADVYLGEHIHLKSLAAIKVLFTRLAEDLQEDFLKEARILARLSHPHIIRILDFGISEGVPYLVMEYAPEGTLRRRHPRNTKLPVATVVEYVEQIADGLQYAHDQKLIHRDLKPDNVLIGQQGNLLLSDFGVALIAATTHVQGAEVKLAGTALYMAPEQSQGKPQFASDQYALGIMVYEWLCGTRPFHGSLIELYSQHYFVTPAPLREHVPAHSPEVERVVMRALAKDPDQRFASVKDFARALKQASQATQLVDAVRITSSQAPSPAATRSQDNSDLYRTALSQDSSDIYRTILSQDAIDIAQTNPLSNDADNAQALPGSDAFGNVQTAPLRGVSNDVQGALQQEHSGVSLPVSMQQDTPVLPRPASLQERTSQMKWARLISLNANGLHRRLLRQKVLLLVVLAIMLSLGAGVTVLYATKPQSRRLASITVPTTAVALTATSNANGVVATVAPASLTDTSSKPSPTVGPSLALRPTQVPVRSKPTAKPGSASPMPTSTPVPATPTPNPPTPTPTPTPIPTPVPVAPTPEPPTPTPEPPTPTPTPEPATPTPTSVPVTATPTS